MFTAVDHKILRSIQAWRRPWLSKVFVGLTYTGTGKAWIVWVVILNALDQMGVTFVRFQGRFLKALFCALLAWGVGYLLKRYFSRPRPSTAILDFELVVPPPACGSFPSSHTGASMAFFAGLLMLAHPDAWIVGIWATLVSFSRLYLGVHYPSDVAGGLAVGFGSAFVVVVILSLNGFV